MGMLHSLESQQCEERGKESCSNILRAYFLQGDVISAPVVSSRLCPPCSGIVQDRDFG